MMKKVLFIFCSTLIAFLLWAAGEAILWFRFPESGYTEARIWALIVVVGTCVFNCLHFRRIAKKQREKEENERYKNVY